MRMATYGCTSSMLSIGIYIQVDYNLKGYFQLLFELPDAAIFNLNLPLYFWT